MNWDLSVSIHINEIKYLPKVKNLLQGTFSLLNSEQQELLTIESKLDWLDGNASYDIHMNDSISVDLSPETLLFLIHNCNYFMALSGNGSGAEALSASV